MRPAFRKRKRPPSSDPEDSNDDLASRIHRTRQQVFEHHKRRADNALDKAVRGKDDIMMRMRRMVEQTHPDEIAKIHGKLFKDLDAQNTLLADLWGRVAQLDEQAKTCFDKLHTDIRNAAAEAGQARAASLAALQSHLSNERKGVEVFRMSVEGSNPLGPAAVRHQKKPRKTDTTLVDSE